MRFANRPRRYLSAMREISSPLSGFASPFGPQRGFNPLRIFANDEPGVWFEANDANTLFTDVAGTTPVTTPGDAVALQLDKSGRGNHRTQATTAARPLYALHPVGGVRNELEYTEEFDNAVWLTGGLSDLVPSLDAPSEGPSSSFVFTPTTATSGSHTLRQNISISGVITQTVYAKASGYNFFALTFDNIASKAVRFDLSNGTVTSEGADVTGSIELIGDGWYRVSVTIETGCSSVSWYSLATDRDWET